MSWFSKKPKTRRVIPVWTGEAKISLRDGSTCTRVFCGEAEVMASYPCPWLRVQTASQLIAKWLQASRDFGFLEVQKNRWRPVGDVLEIVCSFEPYGVEVEE